MTKEPGTFWRQERPEWCKYKDKCGFQRRVMDSICGGRLLKPEPHGAGFNTYRVCMRFTDDDSIFDMETNDTDLEWLRWIFDALDGKVTSWLSKKAAKIKDVYPMTQ